MESSRSDSSKRKELAANCQRRRSVCIIGVIGGRKVGVLPDQSFINFIPPFKSLRPFLRLRAIALALRVGLAFAAAHA